MENKTKNKKIFEGLKIAEFAWIVVGPSTSRYFAEHGATVVKIESHKRLDTNRVNSPFVNNVPNPDNSMFYGRHNPNKFSVSIDMKSLGGLELAWKLIEWADIVTESFSPGTMEKWGLGYEDVRKRRPDIIYFSSSMQGRGGPHSSYAGYGQNAVNFLAPQHLQHFCHIVTRARTEKFHSLRIKQANIIFMIEPLNQRFCRQQQ